MKIKKLRKQLKKFQQEHGNVPVVMAGYGWDDTIVDGIELARGDLSSPSKARPWSEPLSWLHAEVKVERHLGRDVKVVTWYDESGERRYANAWSAPRFPRHRLPERPYPKGLVFLNEQGDWDRRVGYDGVQWVVRAHGV